MLETDKRVNKKENIQDNMGKKNSCIQVAGSMREILVAGKKRAFPYYYYG